MAKLKRSRIWRGGSQAGGYSPEKTPISIVTGQGVLIDFTIASKGGGRTALRVQLLSEDFPKVLTAIATVMRAEYRKSS